MKLLVVGLIAAGLLSGLTVAQQPDTGSLVRAIVSVAEPDIEVHRRPSPHWQTDGPRHVDVGSFVLGIREALGETISMDEVLAASGPAAVPATRDEAISRDGVRDRGVYIRLDSLRAVRPESGRLVGTVQWIFTAFRAGMPYPYPRAFRFCLDPLEEGWSVVGSRQVPPLQFPSPPAPLDCELE